MKNTHYSYINSHIQEFTHTGIHKYRNSQIQEFTHTGIHTYRNSHIQEFTHTGIHTSCHLLYNFLLNEYSAIKRAYDSPQDEKSTVLMLLTNAIQ